MSSEKSFRKIVLGSFIIIIICFSSYFALTVIWSAENNNNNLDENTGEMNPILQKAMSIDSIDTIVSFKFKPTYLNANGEFIQNQNSWTDPVVQGEGAYWAVIYSIRNNDSTVADLSLKAIELALTHLKSDHTIEGGELKELYRFLVYALASCTFLEASIWANSISTRINAVISKMKESAELVLDNIIFDSTFEDSNNQAACAFIAYKIGLNQQNIPLIQKGDDFLTDFFSHQEPEGYYTEAAGTDTSYQMVSCFVLYFIYLTKDVTDTVKTAISQSLEKAYTWEIERINITTGYIDDTNNTRTANSIENSPEHKVINYYDVAIAFCYLYSLDYTDANNYAISITNYIINNH